MGAASVRLAKSRRFRRSPMSAPRRETAATELPRPASPEHTHARDSVAYASPSPHEELARRVIRAMDVRVAVHARPSEHAIALAGRDRGVVVYGRRMPGRHVAALTEHRHAHVQHAIVRRAVRVVTGGAALAYRRVFPQHRPAHLRVTARTGFIDRASDLERLHVADRPVRVMARRARHLAFADGHVRHCPLGLHHLHSMAGGAELRLGRLHQLARHRFRAYARCGTSCT